MKKSSKKYKENPLLVVYNGSKKDGKSKNPHSKASFLSLSEARRSPEFEMLWLEAVSMKPEITKVQFEEALMQFFQQHGTWPVKLTLEDVPFVDEEKYPVGIDMGESDKIFYHAPNYSRKAENGPTEYIHKTRSKLISTPDGKGIFYSGKKLRVENGWLYD